MENQCREEAVIDDGPDDDGCEGNDPTEQFVTKGDKKGSGWTWTCNCCGDQFNGKRRKLTKHIAGKKFLNDQTMDVRACQPPAFIRQEGKLIANTEGINLLKRARPILCRYIEVQDDKSKKKAAKEDTKRRVVGDEVEVVSADPPDRTQTAITSMFHPRRTAETKELDSAIAAFTYHHAVAFNAVESPYFQHVIDAALKVGASGTCDYKVPSRKVLSGRLLDERDAVISESVTKILQNTEEFGYTLTSDGFSDCQRYFYCILYYANSTVERFMDCHNTAFHAGTD
jgi:hypothetical protein